MGVGEREREREPSLRERAVVLHSGCWRRPLAPRPHEIASLPVSSLEIIKFRIRVTSHLLAAAGVLGVRVTPAYRRHDGDRDPAGDRCHDGSDPGGYSGGAGESRVVTRRTVTVSHWT